MSLNSAYNRAAQRLRARWAPKTPLAVSDMVTHDASEEGGHADVLAAVARQLGDGHRELRERLARAEGDLLADVSPRQKRKLLRYKELLDELHTVYNVAAFEAGRQATPHSSVETPEDVIALLHRAVAALRDWRGTQEAEGIGDVPARPIQEELAELAKQVPPEDWAKLPADLSDNLDHYLYGTPKR